MEHTQTSGRCGFCLLEKPSYRYQTVAVELPTRDGGIFRDGEADWNVCATCSDLVETRRWTELAERVYAARAPAIPQELRPSVREAAQHAIDMFSSAALAPRRPLLDLGDCLVPVPTPQEVAAFSTSLESDDEDAEGPEVADWDWIAEEIERAKAAGELTGPWVVESDLSFLGEFFFAVAKYRLNGEEGQVYAQAVHEFDGNWTIVFDLQQPDEEELDLGPREIVAVLQRAEETLLAAGAVFVDMPAQEAGHDAN